MSARTLATTLITLALAAGSSAAALVDDLLTEYAAAGAGPFDPTAGAALWNREHPGGDGPRSCASCHTADPTAPGRHAATGKAIGPLAPSADARRLSDRAEVDKWLLRNCKWTLGRPCTPQEKGDLLSWLRTQ
jgi:mono/diheme cytochrome c family protein